MVDNDSLDNELLESYATWAWKLGDMMREYTTCHTAQYSNVLRLVKLQISIANLRVIYIFVSFQHSDVKIRIQYEKHWSTSPYHIHYCHVLSQLGWWFYK